MRNASLVMIGLLLLGNTPAWASHDHPAKAKQLKVTFVTAYNQCTTPPMTHDFPLGLPACTPTPATNGNPANKLTFGPRGSLSATLGVISGDIKVSAKGADILNNGAAFSGSLLLVLDVRLSDHGCSGTPCTTVDFQLPIAISCTAGKCSAKTSVNAAFPGIILLGGELNLELHDVTVRDPDNETAFRAGLFVP